jgi:hypothetical protein
MSIIVGWHRPNASVPRLLSTKRRRERERTTQPVQRLRGWVGPSLGRARFVDRGPGSESVTNQHSVDRPPRDYPVERHFLVFLVLRPQLRAFEPEPRLAK